MRDALKKSALVAVFGVLVIGTGFYALVQIQGPSPLALGSLRLGMDLTQSREALPDETDWTTRVDASGDVVVEGRDATLHFHEGMLVVAALDLPPSSPDADGPDLEVTEFALLRRSDRSDGRVHAELISRTCPTHRELVAQILRDAEESP